MRGDDDCEHQCDRELGWMVWLTATCGSRREPLINVVNGNKPKVLTSPKRANRLGPKGKGAGIGAPNSPIADSVPPAERQNPSTTLSTGAQILPPDNRSLLGTGNAGQSKEPP